MSIRLLGFPDLCLEKIIQNLEPLSLLGLYTFNVMKPIIHYHLDNLPKTRNVRGVPKPKQIYWFEVTIIYDDDGFKLLLNSEFRQKTAVTLTFHKKEEFDNMDPNERQYVTVWNFFRDFNVPVHFNPSVKPPHLKFYNRKPLETLTVMFDFFAIFPMFRSMVSLYFNVNKDLESYMYVLDYLVGFRRQLKNRWHVVRVKGKLLENNPGAYSKILRAVRQPHWLQLLSGPGPGFQFNDPSRLLASCYIEISDAYWLQRETIKQLYNVEVVRLRRLRLDEVYQCVLRWKESWNARILEIQDITDHPFRGGIFENIQHACNVWPVPRELQYQFRDILDHYEHVHDEQIGTIRLYHTGGAGLLFVSRRTVYIHTFWPLGPFPVADLVDPVFHINYPPKLLPNP